MLLLPRQLFATRLSMSKVLPTVAPPGPVFDPDLIGDAQSPPRGKPATSEKKKDVLNVGVWGFLTNEPVTPARGVFNMDPNPPGENSPFAVGECNHANTFDESSNEPGVPVFP
mmetsp:Transcript_8178/g.9516  ORF Transcript_8178/g.9516 Transcript_8178/m.9516 type:complete len:113 (+) Transcript_8178:1584-1922(+)